MQGSERRFVVSACFAVLLLYVAMIPGFPLPLPPIIDLNINPLNFALIRLFLTLPILAVGDKFSSMDF